MINVNPAHLQGSNPIGALLNLDGNNGADHYYIWLSGAGSSLVVQLTGTTAGTGYSQLNVTGTANLSGNPTLTVTLGSFVRQHRFGGQ